MGDDVRISKATSQRAPETQVFVYVPFYCFENSRLLCVFGGVSTGSKIAMAAAVIVQGTCLTHTYTTRDRTRRCYKRDRTSVIMP